MAITTFGPGDYQTWGDTSNDPRSPEYDDHGEEAWCESRYVEIIDDVANELDDDDIESIVDTVLSQFSEKTDPDHTEMLKNIVKVIEKMASDQADKEWSDRND